jgi:hypothetical protein
LQQANKASAKDLAWAPTQLQRTNDFDKFWSHLHAFALDVDQLSEFPSMFAVGATSLSTWPSELGTLCFSDCISAVVWRELIWPRLLEASSRIDDDFASRLEAVPARPECTPPDNLRNACVSLWQERVMLADSRNFTRYLARALLEMGRLNLNTAVLGNMLAIIDGAFGAMLSSTHYFWAHDGARTTLPYVALFLHQLPQASQQLMQWRENQQLRLSIWHQLVMSIPRWQLPAVQLHAAVQYILNIVFQPDQAAHSYERNALNALFDLLPGFQHHLVEPRESDSDEEQQRSSSSEDEEEKEEEEPRQAPPSGHRPFVHERFRQWIPKAQRRLK